MKYIKYTFLIVMCLFSLYSCEDEINNGSNVSHSFVTTSFGNIDQNIQVNSMMSFIDLSKGIKSLEWSFPDDAIDTELSPIATSSEAVATVGFTTPGEHEIKITQNFYHNVWSDGVQLDSNVNEETIIVNVLDSVRADFTAKCVEDDIALTIQSGALNEFYAGRTLEFTDASTGIPSTSDYIAMRNDGYRLEFDGQPASKKFGSVGAYDIMYIASSAFGTDTIVYENLINIVASSEPVTLDEITRVSKTQIALAYSRDISDSEYEIEAFTLNVISDTDVEVPVNVSNVSLDSKLKNIVLLDLDAEIINSDKITLSYNAEIGTIVSSDGMFATSYNERTCDIEVNNLLEDSTYDYTIENSSASNWVFDGWAAPYDGYTLEVNSTFAHSGSKSLELNMNSEGGAIFVHKDDAGKAHTISVTAGKPYEFGFWVYIEELGNSELGEKLSPDLRFIPSDWGPEVIYVFDEDFSVGEWVYVSQTWTPKSDGEYSFFTRGYNASSSVPTVLHVDDVLIFEKEVRTEKE